MAIIGEMKKLTIGGSTYTIPEYSLPIASASTLGGVKIGTGLSINSTTGVLSATGLDFDEADPVFVASAAYGITQNDIDGWNLKTSNTGTVTKVTAGTGLSIGSTSGGNFTTSGTINHTNSVTAQTTQAVYPIKIDAQGHISGYGSAVTSMPASDVSSWAKAASKPSYNFSEIGSKPTTLSGYGITDAYTKTEVNGLVSGILHYKGTKATVADVAAVTSKSIGDVWHVTADGSEWAYDGDAWQELGTAVDLSGYVTTDDSRLSDARTPLAHNQALSTITGADDLKAIEALTGTSGLLKKTAANKWALDTSTYLTSYTETDPIFGASAAAGITETDISNWNSKTSNTGTVTSVQVQASSPLQSSTSTAQSNTLNTKISFINQNKNLVLAGPSTGTAAAPTFRALVAADIPDLSETYLTSYTETDPTVPSWAKAATKPTYTASEVGALPSTTVIPSKTSDLTNDSGFITSYTDENMKWTASTSSNTYYPLQSTSTAATSTANTLNSVSFYQYYNTAGGYRRLILGNATAYTSTGGAYGAIRLYGAAATYYGDLIPGVLSTSSTGRLTGNRTWTLPDKTGTVALTSDIPTVSYPVTSVNTKTGAVVLTASDVGALPDTTVIPTKTSELTNDSGFITTDKDQNVKQTNETASTYAHPVLIGYNVGNTEVTAQVFKDFSHFSYTPSTGNLVVTKLNNYTPAAAMAKAVDTSISAASTSANLPTSAAVAAFVEGKGYITSADVPEGASAYTGTISAVTSGNASAGSNNGFARGDHTHNITKTTIDTVLGTGSGTTKFYREDGTWATPAYPTTYSLGIYGTSGSSNSSQWAQAFSTKLFFKAGDNMGLTKDDNNIVFNAIIPDSTQSATTGITATTTATKTTLGTANSVTGVSGSTTASKASGSNGSASNWVFEDVACDDITDWSAGSGSASLTFTMDTTDTKKLKISFSHAHTAPSLTYSAKTASHVKSGDNGTAPSWSFTDVTVPVAAASATSIPNVSVTSATVSITDNGHTHTI